MRSAHVVGQPLLASPSVRPTRVGGGVPGPLDRIRRAYIEPVLVIDPCRSVLPDCWREGNRPEPSDPEPHQRERLRYSLC